MLKIVLQFAAVLTIKMDVDNDIDSQLLQQFSAIQTTDREVLVAEFQRLLGNQLGEDGCIFFLDMNNWYVLLRICGKNAIIFVFGVRIGQSCLIEAH